MEKYDPKHATFLDSDDKRERKEPEEIISFLDLKKDDTVLDLGAGTGFLTFSLAEELTEGEVYAVDIREEMIKKLEEKCGEKG
ncbi:MAG: class I SAM-dependent methyltransferase, partial [Candidatus Thermoplasmatota archaeon]|nr:class I SAM-dependent methyltransferase [Candidatus Thermoplasmatota archaeon]